MVSIARRLAGGSRLRRLLVPMFTTLGCRGLNSEGAPAQQGSPLTVSVTPAASSISIGASVRLTATARGANGQTVHGAPVTWKSARPDVATVSQSGMVTGVAEGVDTITATSGTSAGHAVVLVEERGERSDVVFMVNTAVTHPISRFIYGVNHLTGAWGDARLPRVTLNRVGGNRLSAYNWENNYSNAGNDYRFQNDSYLSESAAPGDAVRDRADKTFARGAALMVTVPMMGYVAGNNQGVPLDTATSTRKQRLAQHFKVSKAAKGAAFSLKPDAGDGFVYQDEFVNWLDKTYPAARTDSVKPIFYNLDNEPDIWHATHGEISTDLQTYDGFIDTTIDYARAIKQVVPEALTFGPSVATFAGVLTLGRYPTPDPKYPVWQTHPFLAVYLDRLKQAEQSSGKRLLDVLDVHWYPQMGTSAGQITNDYAKQDDAMIRARLQAPRSLWDPSYDEGSWVSQTASGPIYLLPRLRDMIAQRYPGTKISISEYYYGRGGDISGGIAQADVLGIFGREGVFAATLWPQAAVDAYGGSHAKAYAYVLGAFRAFLDYDGSGSRFGDTGVEATTSDTENTSVYASLDDQGRVVLVAINKRGATQEARIVVSHASPLKVAGVWAMTDGSPTAKRLADPTIDSSNTVSYTMPPMSVSTIVLAP